MLRETPGNAKKRMSCETGGARDPQRNPMKNKDLAYLISFWKGHRRRFGVPCTRDRPRTPGVCGPAPGAAASEGPHKLQSEGVVLLDKVKIDDPVGAWPVHGLCGIWGGIATGIFGEGKDLGVQILGSVAYAVWAFVTMLVIFLVLKTIGLLRVSPEEEMQGLDLCEHGMHAYEQPN